MSFRNPKASALSKVYTRPATESVDLVAFCATIGARPPVRVPITPSSTAAPLACFYNVRDACDASGGEPVFGWAIFEWPGVYLEAQHHAVWRRSDGTLVDETPAPMGGAIETVFVEDDRATFDYDLPNIEHMDRHVLKDWPEIEEYVSIYRPYLRAKATAVEGQPPSERLQRLIDRQHALRVRILGRLAAETSPDEPCICGSDRPFGSCCDGRFDPAP